LIRPVNGIHSTKENTTEVRYAGHNVNDLFRQSNAKDNRSDLCIVTAQPSLIVP